MADQMDLNVQAAPMPRTGAVSAHDLAILDLMAWDMHEYVAAGIQGMVDRKGYGLGKYQVVLHKDNGRDHPKDAWDESADQVVYFRNWFDERIEQKDFETAEWLWPMYQHALWTYAVLSHYRATGEKIPRMARTVTGIPFTHPDHPDYMNMPLNGDGSVGDLYRPWEDAPKGSRAITRQI